MIGSPSMAKLTVCDAATRAAILHVFVSSRRRHTRCDCDWSSDVCSSDLDCAHCSAGAIQIIDEHDPLFLDSFRAHRKGTFQKSLTLVDVIDILEFRNLLSFSNGGFRSEERRVGKECRSRWSPYHLKKNKS